VPLEPKMNRIESVFLGRDAPLLDQMFEFYSPRASKIVDVCCNTRKMWRGSEWASKVQYMDVDPSVSPEIVGSWNSMPFEARSVDVLIYDPPHLSLDAASEKSMKTFSTNYGLGLSCKGDNIQSVHPSFLADAKRVLKPDGLIFAKLKDHIHNHRYQWNVAMFNEHVLASGMTPCDMIIKKDPCAGNLKSGAWKTAHHARNVHCYWVIVRNSKYCEARKNA